MLVLLILKLDRTILFQIELLFWFSALLCVIFSNLISLNLTLMVKEKKISSKVKILMSIFHYSPQISPLHSCLHFPNLFL